MHGPEKTYMDEAYDTNWMSTVGKNINEIESQIADMVGLIQLQRVGAVDFNAHTCCNAFGGDRMLPPQKTLTMQMKKMESEKEVYREL